MRQSILKSQIMNSPILQQKRIQSSGAAVKSKNLLFSMNLTTLIDAFCILVIFLLSNMNGQLQNIQIGKNISLPTANQSDVLNTGIVVRLENDALYIDDKQISLADMPKRLIELKSEEKKSLIIQADRNSDFEKISLLLRAGGQAGFEKYAFAVLPGI